MSERWQITRGINADKEALHGGSVVCPACAPGYEAGGPSGVLLAPYTPPTPTTLVCRLCAAHGPTPETEAPPRREDRCRELEDLLTF